MGGVFIVAPTREERFKAWFDLMAVCRESVERMSFDDITGEVLFHAAPPEGTPSSLVASLSQDPLGYVVQIHPRGLSTFISDPWSSPPPPAGHVVVPICARGAGAWPARFGGFIGQQSLLQIDVAYDPLDYSANTGYRGYDRSGNETPILSQHLLMFALASAGQIAVQLRDRVGVDSTTPYTVDPELSLRFENSVRANGLFPPRVGPLDLYLPTCAVRPGKRPDPPPPPPDVDAGAMPPQGESTGFFGEYRKAGGGTGGGNCFVATAAYGSPYAREVDLLRQFRDSVLRRTQVGDAWFGRFYRHYYEVSPAIAERMRQDSDLAAALRVGVVQPYVGWLELALTMPDAAIDGVPQPWRSFLTQLIDRLDAWSAAIGTPSPEEVSTLPSLEAARELAVVLRYMFRDHGRRLAYLDRLQSAGTLPLRLQENESEEVRRILIEAGLPLEHIARIAPLDDAGGQP